MFLTLEVEGAPASHCFPDPETAFCLASWNEGDTADPGDDTVRLGQRVDHVRVDVRTQALPPASLGLDPSEVAVEHPAYRMLNATWLRLNDSLPPEARAYVTLQSRHLYAYPDQWGVFVHFHAPFPVQVPGSDDSTDEFYAGICWSPCALSNGTLMAMDEDTIRPLPHNLWLRETRSDEYVAAYIDNATTCWYNHLLPEAACEALAAARPTLQEQADVLARLTPAVEFELRYNITEVRVSPEEPTAQADDGASREPTAHAPEHVLAPLPAHEQARASAPEPPQGPPWIARVPAQPGSPSGALAIRASAAVHEAAAGGAPWWLLGSAATLALLWALFHRIDRARALDQATRRKVFEAISAQPGIRTGTIAGKLGLSHNTVLHHVRILQATGVVEAAGSGHLRLFARDAAIGVEARRAALAASAPVAGAVLAHLRAHGPTDLAALRCALSLPKSTASEAVSRLVGAGLAEKRRAGGRLVVGARPVPAQAAPATPPPAAAAP